MKSFIAGIVCGSLLAAVVLGFLAAGDFAFAQPEGASAVKFVGISNSTDKSNTRAIAENGDVYELKRRTVTTEDGKTDEVYYWDKEINILDDQAEYLKRKPE